MNNLNTVLEKAITSNNEELINNVVKLMNTLASNQTNKTNKTNSVVKLMNLLPSNQTNKTNKINNINNIDNTNNINTDNTNNINNINLSKITYVKTPKWLEDLNCSVNPKKKGDNKFLEYAITLSVTTDVNCNKPKNIIPNFNHFNFNNINHLPKEEDHKTFEENNKQSLK